MFAISHCPWSKLLSPLFLLVVLMVSSWVLSFQPACHFPLNSVRADLDREIWKQTSLCLLPLVSSWDDQKQWMNCLLVTSFFSLLSSQPPRPTNCNQISVAQSSCRDRSRESVGHFKCTRERELSWLRVILFVVERRCDYLFHSIAIWASE